MIVAALRTSRDPIARYRALWLAVAFSVSVVLIAIGAGYAFAGSHAALVPHVFQYVAILPGGLRTHGVLLLVPGLVNFWSIAALSQRYSTTAYQVGRVTGIFILFYVTWTAIGFSLGMIVGGQHYNAGVWWYLLLAMLSIAKVSLPPPFRGQSTQDRYHQITGG